jgi:hypothetical protein
MRWKIFLVNGGIVLVLCLVAFVLLRSSLLETVADPHRQRAELERALVSVEARLLLEALAAERWVARIALREEVREVFESGTAEARSQAATEQANILRDQALSGTELARIEPAMLLFVDREGVGIGRNGSELMRGDLVGDAYPSLRRAIDSGDTGSGLWVNPSRQEQLIASYAPVRNLGGKVLGAVVLGTPLNDGRLLRTSELTSGEAIALDVGSHGSRPVAVGGRRLDGFESTTVKAAVEAARWSNVSHAQSAIDGVLFAATRILEFDGSDVVLVCTMPESKVANINQVLWPIYFVAGLGLFLVFIGGGMLGNYISKPISELEEGLLLVANGERDLRFDLKHDVLGGLTTRMNEVLNSVQDTTDIERLS